MKTERRWSANVPRLGIAALLAMASAGVCRAQTAVALPQGVTAVWDFSKAYHETTPTRQRICINGLWLWQPGGGQDGSALDQQPVRGPGGGMGRPVQEFQLVTGR